MDCGNPMGKFTGRKTAEASPGGGGGSGGKSAAGGTSLSGTRVVGRTAVTREQGESRSEEHTSELQSRLHLVCRLLLEKKKKHTICANPHTKGHLHACHPLLCNRIQIHRRHRTPCRDHARVSYTVHTYHRTLQP